MGCSKLSVKIGGAVGAASAPGERKDVGGGVCGEDQGANAIVGVPKGIFIVAGCVDVGGIALVVIPGDGGGVDPQHIPVGEGLFDVHGGQFLRWDADRVVAGLHGSRPGHQTGIHPAGEAQQEEKPCADGQDQEQPGEDQPAEGVLFV